MSRTFFGLDLFCGGGGCTRGYKEGFRNRGFEVHMTGIDRINQPRYHLSYGDQFYQMNALDVLSDAAYIAQFDFVHLSPPCQTFSPTRTMSPGAAERHPDQLTPALNIIKAKYPNKLVVIENVPEAPMFSRVHQMLRLCASSFPGHSAFDERRLLHRHRTFRLHNFRVPRVPCNHNGFKPKGVYGSLNSDVPGGGEIAANMAEAQKLMQIDWMIWHELKEAVPPAYSRYVAEAPGGLVDALIA